MNFFVDRVTIKYVAVAQSRLLGVKSKRDLRLGRNINSTMEKYTQTIIGRIITK